MLCLANVYGQNNDKPMYFSNFFDNFNNFSSYDLILRDFNIILNNDPDKIGGAFQHSNYKAREVVSSHMWAMNLSDSFCILHLFMKTFT